MKQQMLLLMVLLVVCMTPPVMALIEIQASSNTIPISSYTTAMDNDAMPANSAVLTPDEVSHLKPYSIEESEFPVTSVLTPGNVETTAIHLPALTTPIFVVGDDPYSIQWLQVNTATLKKSHAIGLITNVASYARYQSIEQETGWTLLPASLDDIQTLVQVTHVPFLLTSTRLEQ